MRRKETIGVYQNRIQVMTRFDYEKNNGFRSVTRIFPSSVFSFSILLFVHSANRASLFQQSAVSSDGFFETQIERVADEGMTDGYLFQIRNLPTEIAQVDEREVVAGIQP